MKWKFEVNGETKLILDPDSGMPTECLAQMALLSSKGRAYQIKTLPDNKGWSIEPLEYRPAPVDIPTE